MGDADPRSDIYSLGATLYHALTGRAPVNAARRVAGAPLGSPRRIKPTISPVTEQAVMKALSLDPARRFQSAPEFRAALRGDMAAIGASAATEDVASGGATSAVPRYPAGEPARPTRPRSRMLIGLLLVLLFALAVLAGASILPNLMSRPAQIPETTNIPTTPVAATTTTGPAQRATSIAANTDVAPTAADTPTPVATDTPLPACQQGQAAITSPAQGAVLHGTVPVMGTASCEGFAYYKFEFVDPRCGAAGLCFVAGKFTQPVVNGQLMNWDTTRTWDGQRMPNGTYVLRLTVVGQDDIPLPQKPEITITIDNH
jgi:hypothetical protein